MPVMKSAFGPSGPGPCQALPFAVEHNEISPELHKFRNLSASGTFSVTDVIFNPVFVVGPIHADDDDDDDVKSCLQE